MLVQKIFEKLKLFTFIVYAFHLFPFYKGGDWSECIILWWIILRSKYYSRWVRYVTALLAQWTITVLVKNTSIRLRSIFISFNFFRKILYFIVDHYEKTKWLLNNRARGSLYRLCECSYRTCLRYGKTLQLVARFLYLASCVYYSRLVCFEFNLSCDSSLWNAQTRFNILYITSDSALASLRVRP